MLAEVVVNGNVDTPDVTREKVAKAMRRTQNGKAAGRTVLRQNVEEWCMERQLLIG